MWTAFLSHGLPSTLRELPRAQTRRPIVCARGKPAASKGRVQLSARGRLFAGSGALSLALSLLNRLVLTPADVSPFQARADILGVVCGVSLLLYGAGSAQVVERGARVELQGVDAPFECTLDGSAAEEAEFVAAAALNAVQNFVSVAFFLDGQCVGRQGLFRTESELDRFGAGEVVRGAIEQGKVSYLADLRVVPTKEMEFPFLPQECQAVVVVPFGETGAVLFGADKVRPMLGGDFGWLTALCDRLAIRVDSYNER